MLFFFSSRRRHTRYIGDWSSDVCSTNVEYAGIIAGDRPVESSGVVLHGYRLVDFAGNVRDLGKVGGKSFDILLGKANVYARLLPACLHGSSSGYHDHQFRAEIGEDIGTCLTEAIPVCQ